MSLDPQRVLNAVNHLAGNLYELWPNYETVEADLARAALAAPGGEGRSGGVANPTAGIAESHVAYWDTVDNLITALQYLRLAQRRITLVQRNHAPLARQLEQVAKNARCDGGWDPTCVNNAVRNGRCWRCIKAEQRSRTASEGAVVYAVQAAGNHVKIGFTTDLNERLKALQTAAALPLKVLGYTHADMDLERELHARFDHHRTSGEWFALDDTEIVELVGLLDVHAMSTPRATNAAGCHP